VDPNYFESIAGKAVVDWEPSSLLGSAALEPGSNALPAALPSSASATIIPSFSRRGSSGRGRSRSLSVSIEEEVEVVADPPRHRRRPDSLGQQLHTMLVLRKETAEMLSPRMARRIGNESLTAAGDAILLLQVDAALHPSPRPPHIPFIPFSLWMPPPRAHCT
jgi:hypothetical protein